MNAPRVTIVKPEPGEDVSFEALYRKIEALPHGLTGEIIGGGEVRAVSRPGSAHRHTQKMLLLALDACERRLHPSQIWWIEREAEVRFGDRLLVPDVAGWRADQGSVCPCEDPIVDRPAWCCEVLTDGTAAFDRLHKLRWYLDAGVAHVWLVDPDGRSVEVYEARGGLPTLVASALGDETATLPPFDLPLAVSDWWEPDENPDAP